MIPANIMKNPTRFIDTDVGSAMRIAPAIAMLTDMMRSFVERILMNLFSIRNNVNFYILS